VRRGSRDGFILVAVLCVLALLASLVGGAALLTRGARDGVRTQEDLLRLDALVRSGVDLAAYQLYGLKLPPDGIAQEIRLDDGTVRLAASDETGRIDLNWAEPPLLAGLAKAAGLRSLAPAAFAGAVVAWRQRDEPPGGIRPTPDGSGPKREGFRSVQDLRWLPGLTGEEVAALAGLVTVHNPSGKLNPLAASPAALLALPGATPQLAAGVAALRRLPPKRAAEEANRLLSAQGAFLTQKPGGAFRVRVEARRGTSVRAADVVLIRAPAAEAPYFVTEWRD
jgi:general secretion pathway protein K